MTKSKTTAAAKDHNTKYAEAINREHDQAQMHAQTAIDHAIRCGELLIAMKKRLKHGEFQDWVKAHCCFSHDTCNVYMRATRKKTRGLVFSSLAALLAYERSEKRGRPEKFIRQHLITPDFGLPEGHDADAWAYAQAATTLLRDIMTHIRYLDPITMARGAIPGAELYAMEALVHRMHWITSELRNVIAQRIVGKPMVRFSDLEWSEIGELMNAAPDKKLLRHASKLCDQQDAEEREQVQRMNGHQSTTVVET
jgi:hypothetical protein